MTRRPGVIGLAWYVDYRNGLGWRDPYAQRAWTERQRSNARLLKNEVYTPALVVNGTAMLVGSDGAAVRRAIAQATPPSLAVSLRRSASGLEADFGPIPDAATGILVTYDPELATRVGAGENQGRRLVEYRVVRDIAMYRDMTPRLRLPAVPDGRGATLLVQDAAWRVIGAADLPPGRDS